MSVPTQGGGQHPPPSSTSLTLSSTDLTKATSVSVSQIITKSGSGNTIVGAAKVPLISHIGASNVLPRPILAAPTIGSAQLKVIQTSTQGSASNQVQIQSSIAPQDLPVDLAAPKKSTGQIPATITPVVGHAPMQHIATSVISNTNPISVTTTTPAAASSVKLGSSASATPIQTLRIPTIPAVSTLRTGSPQVISAPHVVHGTRTNVTLPRGPGQPALAVAVPKSVPGAISNLAVVHQVPQVGGNKVTVLQQGANIISRGKTATFQTTGTIGATGATTIIRPQSGASYPVTIRAPIQAGPTSQGNATIPGVTSQAIRLTTPGVSGAITGQASAVHFVPVSVANASGQPASSSGTAVRHASGGSSTASQLPTLSFRPGQAAIVTAPRQTVVAAAGQTSNTTPGSEPAGTVRVTLVQTPIGLGKSTVSQPTLMSTGSSSQPVYKPVTITAQQTGQAAVGVGGSGGIRTSINATTLVPTPLSVGLASSTNVSATINTQPVRIGPIAGGTRTFSTSTGSQPLTVSISPATVGSHISVPLAPLQASNKNIRMPVGTAVSAAGKLIQMPIMATSNPPTGVTIQKTTITANPAPRTISLPYGTTQVSAISKPAGHALPVASITGVPVARVCPQPLNIPSASSAIASPNLVTITSSTSTAVSVSSTDISNATASGVQVQGIPTTGSVYIARPAQAHAVVPQISIGSASQQPVAINLTNTGGGAKILTSNQQSTISRVVTSNVPFTYGSDQTSSVTSTVSSTAQLIASAANALASSSQIQQQISGNSTITTISGAKISLPTQPARFVALPTQPATMLHQSPGCNISQPAAILTSQSLHEHDMAVRNASIASSANPALSLVSSNPNTLPSGAQIPSSPSKPGILRRREIEREPLGSISPSRAIHNTNNSMTDQFGPTADRGPDSDGSSSGSTTLSATSSPGGAGNGVASRIGDGNLSGDESMAVSGTIVDVPQSTQPTFQPSPRKKPRKQLLPPTNDVQDSAANAWMFENENQNQSSVNYPTNMLHNSSEDNYGDTRRKNPHHRFSGTLRDPMSPQMQETYSSAFQKDTKEEDDFIPTSNYLSDKPRMSLRESYRHTWKSRHNHFLRYSDVRVKDDRRPTVNELANTTNVLQKINGWKIYHLSSTMEDIVDVESELTQRLSGLQKRLEKVALPDLSSKGDLGKVHELIKANLQRSKVIQDQIKESKTHALELFDHKSKVTEIINKYVSKRQVKQRDVK